MTKNEIKICYGIGYLGSPFLFLSQLFTVKYRNKDKHIESVLEKFKIIMRKVCLERYKNTIDVFIEFTYGTLLVNYCENDYIIHAIAVTHEKDNFSRKTGRSIVESRLKCTAEWIKKKKSTVKEDVDENSDEFEEEMKVKSDMIYIERLVDSHV